MRSPVKIIKLAFIAAIFASLSLTASQAATLKGKVTAIIGSDITIQLDGALMPRPGDPVEVVFKTPDGDEVPVGTWTVSKVDGKKVRAKKNEAFGTAEVGYTATIESARPVRSLAERVKKLAPAAGQTPKGPTRTVIGVSIKNAEPDHGVKGVLVARVAAGGPAASAGVQPGDIIVEYNAGRVQTPAELAKRVQAGRPGNPMLVTILRNGDRRQLIIVPEARPVQTAKQTPEPRRASDLLDKNYKVAREYYFGHKRKKDYAKAYDLFMEGAEKGHLKSMVMVGAMHEVGRHVKKNQTTAISWYRKATDAGSPFGQTNLGMMYEYGRGVTRDYERAARLYKKAADQNHYRAQAFLGEAYADGRGVPKDLAKAVRLYQKSVDQGYKYAMLKLADLYKSGKGVNRDYGKARDLYQLAAKKNSTRAHYELGKIYRGGKGVKRDYEKAVKYYRYAANKGHAAAQNSFGHMLMNGFGIKRNYRAAALWYRKAAEKGNSSAMFNLGFLHSLGLLGSRDLQKAEKWFASAERKNDRYNLYAIARAFDGKDKQWNLGKDKELALHFYRRAADRGDRRARKHLNEIENETESDSYSTNE